MADISHRHSTANDHVMKPQFERGLLVRVVALTPVKVLATHFQRNRFFKTLEAYPFGHDEFSCALLLAGITKLDLVDGFVLKERLMMIGRQDVVA